MFSILGLCSALKIANSPHILLVLKYIEDLPVHPCGVWGGCGDKLKFDVLPYVAHSKG